MTSTPVAILLVLTAVIFLAIRLAGYKERQPRDSIYLVALFFCSGMPALIYQIVWQRALFAIYGVNTQSVVVVVTAFMLGIGAGSFVGGRLSARFPRQGILIFGIAELGVAAFGLCSLSIFRWVSSYTAGASLPFVVCFSLLLLLLPTMLMGATLPLLVEHLVLRTRRVGVSVSILYFANTFGSAVACYVCAKFLLRDFGQSGAVSIAACINAGVGATAYLGARSVKNEPEAAADPAVAQAPSPSLPLSGAMLLAGLSGFIALGFEIVWFRVFSMASSDRAPAFALLLATYLAGIAMGSVLSERLMARRPHERTLPYIGLLLLLAGVLSMFLPPLVAAFMARNIQYLQSAPAFLITAALIGSVFPLICQLAISPGRDSGRAVSLIYISNIAGAALGGLGVGFVLMQHFGLRSTALGLGAAAIAAGGLTLLFQKNAQGTSRIWAIALTTAGLALVPLAASRYSLLFERLVFGDRPEARVPFVRVVENRNGVIGVTADGAVFGGGVYDGYFNVDPRKDVNLVARAYALSAFCKSPRRILVIGLASGSWAQIFANHPDVETLDAVEINPGYLQLIPQYSMVRSLLQNPKVKVYVDDGRRWLLAHPGARYDAIIANTTFNWRDHSTGLLSEEFLRLIREHLRQGGIYYFNSTESDETIATALKVFPYGLRVVNFVAVSDSPIVVDKEQWRGVLLRYKIDGNTVLDPADPAADRVLAAYMALADSVHTPPRFLGMESAESLRFRLGRQLIITDDNMGLEWRSEFTVLWH